MPNILSTDQREPLTPGDYITIDEACAIVGGTKPVSRPTLYRYIKSGRFPAPEHPTPGTSRMRKSKLLAALTALG